MSKPVEAGAAAGAEGGELDSVNVIGDIVQHVAAGQEATCEFTASAGITRESIDINILSPSKVPVSYR